MPWVKVGDPGEVVRGGKPTKKRESEPQAEKDGGPKCITQALVKHESILNHRALRFAEIMFVFCCINLVFLILNNKHEINYGRFYFGKTEPGILPVGFCLGPY